MQNNLQKHIKIIPRFRFRFISKIYIFLFVFRIWYESHLPNDSMPSNQFTCISCSRDHCQTPPWIHLEGRAASSCPGWLANLPPCDTVSAPWQGAGGQGQGGRKGKLVTFWKKGLFVNFRLAQRMVDRSFFLFVYSVNSSSCLLCVLHI